MEVEGGGGEGEGGGGGVRGWLRDGGKDGFAVLFLWEIGVGVVGL